MTFFMVEHELKQVHAVSYKTARLFIYQRTVSHLLSRLTRHSFPWISYAQSQYQKNYHPNATMHMVLYCQCETRLRIFLLGNVIWLRNLFCTEIMTILETFLLFGLAITSTGDRSASD